MVPAGQRITGSGAGERNRASSSVAGQVNTYKDPGGWRPSPASRNVWDRPHDGQRTSVNMSGINSPLGVQALRGVFAFSPAGSRSDGQWPSGPVDRLPNGKVVDEQDVGPG